ncbi:hypothetical protein RI367_005167 [Sorochytrium milnesiophthora]
MAQVIPPAQSGTVAAVALAPQSVVWSTDAEIPRVPNVPFPVTFKIDKPYTEDMSFNVSSPDIQFQNCSVEVKKGFTTAVAMAQLLKPQLLPLETKKTATVQGSDSHNIQHPGWYQAIKSELINLQVQFQPCGNSSNEQCLVELRDFGGITEHPIRRQHQFYKDLGVFRDLVCW